VLGGYVAGTGQWVAVALAALVTLLVGASANAWNDYLDIEIDKVNRPDRVLPSGLVSPDQARQFFVILTVISLILAAFINLPAFLITFCSHIVLYVYSLRLKSTVLLGNLTVALISSLTIILGGVAAGNVGPTFLLAGIIAVGILGREVLKTLADYDGDLSQDCKTVSTVLGKRAARIIFYLLALSTAWVMLVPHMLQVYRPVYAYIVLVGVLPVIAYVLIRVAPGATARQLEKLSQLMKYDFMVWFVAVILGAR
jgi:geranylgeranylglycerol-phosphate geranylgeranyltransferase